MKLLHILFFLPVMSFAQDDHAASVANLNQKQDELTKHLTKLGVYPSKKANELEDDEKPHSLFKIHDQNRNLTARQGQFLFGRTINRLVVSSEGSPAVVELGPSQGILSGARILGTARMGANPERLQIDFQKLTFKSGHTLFLSATAMDIDGAYGLKAQVVSQKALAVMGAMASSFIAGLAVSQQSQTVNAFGFEQTQRTGRNAVLQGVGQTAADQSKRLINEATAEKPILIVESETSVSVFVQEELRQ